jgi:hypothetical protein
VQEAQQKRGDRVAALTAKKEAAAFQKAAKVAMKITVMGCGRCMNKHGVTRFRGKEDVTGLTSTLIKLRCEQSLQVSYSS